jgi:periplasmic divalent cation tolerance protein
MSDSLIVFTAAGDEETAKSLLRSAVQAKLAGSGQVIGPIHSAYWHLGEFGEGTEYKVQFMTTADRYDELEAHLIKAREGENWEITAVSIERGSAAYLTWLSSVCGTSQSSDE